MATVYTRRSVRQQFEAESNYYARTEGEERAAKWDRQVLTTLNKIAANPYRAGTPVRQMPANHRRILIGKTHWLYYRIEDDGQNVLVYWLHGFSQESRKLTPIGLKRKATEAAKERGDEQN